MDRLTPSKLEALEQELGVGGDIVNTNSGWPCRRRLHTAVQEGDLLLVELLLRFGANVRAPDYKGEHPLHKVVALTGPGAVPIIKALLVAGADVNAQNCEGDTTLSLAYWNNHPFCVRALIRTGADPGISGSRGTPTPPFVVDLLRSSDGASVVAKVLATGIDVNAKDKNGDTLLDRAAFCGSPSAVIALLRAGADARVKTEWPPLCSAAELMQQEGGAEAVRALVEAGADIEPESGWAPLCCAVYANSPAAVRLLLQLGADPDRTLGGGRAAIHFATWYRDDSDCQEMVNILLRAGADINLQDRDQRTALHDASRRGLAATTRLLLASGADPNIRYKNGKTALHHALGSDGKCSVEVVSALCKAGADINTKDRFGQTPLHYASHYCSSSISWFLGPGVDLHARRDRSVKAVLALLKAGADIDTNDTEVMSFLLQEKAGFNVADDTGATLLHHTSRRSSPFVNRLLLTLGASPHIRDTNGRTPLFDAIFHGEHEHYIYENVVALLEAGAGIDAMDDCGFTPLLHAISTSSVSCTRLLLSLGAHSSSGPACGPVPLRTLIKMVRQAGMDVVLVLVLWLGIDINGSGYRMNPSDLSHSEKAGCMILMGELREKCLTHGSPTRNALIVQLSLLYHVLRCYPADAALDECEVVLSKDRASKSGGFGDCWEGVFLGSHKVAMKSPRDRFTGEGTRRLLREMRVWSRLSHPNVLPFLGWHQLGSVTYLVSPWMTNGHISEFVRKHPEADSLKLLVQVASGLEYLHTFQPPVIHGDLRGPNILISQSGDVRIADFGLSELKADEYYSTPWFCAGHPAWQAPELLRAETNEEARRTAASDVFAFGRVMLEIFTMKVPFFYIHHRGIAKRVEAGELPNRPCDHTTVARGLDDTMWSLMVDCWDAIPSQRPSAIDLVSRLRAAVDSRELEL
ncbi:hypothetical protein BOTBODRAFT_38446 [Botryobasidium botryosum FD-172 SS1]|uniref:Protein kinase domain-containing protein n=1 Tax=Botryobasidium botryosum (strain FD-172 SS1) TaxID=930990 RepID=A0A067M7S0_BOTB1|nr:hypothetical protein BOTBODRAFT_38446 [Botryobasidium botryosum FD-172 SS1]